MRYIGMLMIAIILTGTIATLFTVLFGEDGSESLILFMVVITQNIIMILLMVYIIELIKKVRLPR